MIPRLRGDPIRGSDELAQRPVHRRADGAVPDALDALGLPGALHGIGPLTGTARAA
jgi:hypothetical protein